MTDQLKANWILVAIVSLVIVVATVVVVVHVYQQDSKSAAFQNSVCALSKSQANEGVAFQKLLKNLERHAIRREHQDTVRTSIQADADLARLFGTILDDYKQSAKHPIKLAC